MTASAAMQPFKAEIKELEDKVKAAFTTGDFAAFKSAALGIDQAHARYKDFPSLYVQEMGRVSVEQGQWDMTASVKDDRPLCIFLLTSKRSFLPGHADMVSFMVDRGLDLNRVYSIVGRIRGAPMSHAATNGSPEIMQVMIDLGGSPHGPLKAGQLGAGLSHPMRQLLLSGTAMPAAHYAQKLDILMKAGASLADFRARIVESSWDTPLSVAASSGRWEPVLALLQLGEDALERSTTEPEKTAFEFAVDKLNPVQQESMRGSMAAWVDASRASNAIDTVIQASGGLKGRVSAP